MLHIFAPNYCGPWNQLLKLSESVEIAYQNSLQSLCGHDHPLCPGPRCLESWESRLCAITPVTQSHCRGRDKALLPRRPDDSQQMRPWSGSLQRESSVDRYQRSFVARRQDTHFQTGRWAVLLVCGGYLKMLHAPLVEQLF